MRYLKQKEKTAICGPVAVLNLWKWLGYQVSWETHSTNIKKLVKYQRGHGTPVDDMAAYLKAAHNAIRIDKPKISLIDDLLDKKNLIILKYAHIEPAGVYGHYCLLIDRDKDGYAIINNANARKAVEKISRDTLKLYLKTIQEQSRYPYSIAWVITSIK